MLKCNTIYYLYLYTSHTVEYRMVGEHLAKAAVCLTVLAYCQRCLEIWALVKQQLSANAETQLWPLNLLRIGTASCLRMNGGGTKLRP